MVLLANLERRPVSAHSLFVLDAQLNLDMDEHFPYTLCNIAELGGK